ncbi:Uncharacterised protein [Mycobacteroides abscessus subsp. abscessus]|nr:Uncharacterised protein [Mycobacteroides abscessus subsp. abscessus]
MPPPRQAGVDGIRQVCLSRRGQAPWPQVSLPLRAQAPRRTPKKNRASGPVLLRRLNAQRCAASERACEAALFSAATGGVLPSKAAVSWVLSTGSMRS